LKPFKNDTIILRIPRVSASIARLPAACRFTGLTGAEAQLICLLIAAASSSAASTRAAPGLCIDRAVAIVGVFVEISIVSDYPFWIMAASYLLIFWLHLQAGR
jgi:hypothetical protein